ncbi:hypothetical protein RHS03_07981, partial [Rhizoctonia solani]
MSSELFDYIEAVKPSLGDAKRAKVGLILIHYITLARVSHGRVRIDTVLTTSGESFVQKVLRNMSVVRGLGFALKVDMTAPYDDSPIPKGLQRLCVKYGIDSDECLRRNKQKAERARNEMWDLIIFVRVAQAIMGALHEDTLRGLDESYVGHRPAGYRPRTKWLGLATEHLVPAVRARDLQAPKRSRPVRNAATTPISQRRDETSTRGRLAESRRRYPGPVSSNIKPQDINDPMDTLLEALVALLLDSGGLLGEVLAGTRSGLGLVICYLALGSAASGSTLGLRYTLVLLWFLSGSLGALLWFSRASTLGLFLSGVGYAARTWSLADTTSSKSLHRAFFEILALENDEAMQGTYHLFRKMAHAINYRRSKAGQLRMAGEGTRGRGYAPICAPRRGSSGRLASIGLAPGYGLRNTLGRALQKHPVVGVDGGGAWELVRRALATPR